MMKRYEALRDSSHAGKTNDSNSPFLGSNGMR